MFQENRFNLNKAKQQQKTTLEQAIMVEWVTNVVLTQEVITGLDNGQFECQP